MASDTMTPPTFQRFRGEVIVKISLALDAYGQQDAEARARRITRTRSRIRDAEIDSVTITPMTVTQRLDHDNLCVWQEAEALALGSANQRMRWNNGVLPENELLLMVREEMFRPFALVPRRSRKGPTAIRHDGDMAGCAVDGAIPVRWTLDDDPALSDPEWATLQRILTGCEEARRHRWLQHSPPTCVRLAIRGHHGECLTCHGKTAEIGALVEIEWAGRSLTREYVL